MKTTVLYTLKTILLFTFIFFIACDSTTESKNSAPVISAVVVNPSSVAANGITTVTVTATDADDDPLTYAYDPNGGAITANGASANWTAPGTAGAISVTVTVTDGQGGEANGTGNLTVTAPVTQVIGTASFQAGVNGDLNNAQVAIYLSVNDWVNYSPIKYTRITGSGAVVSYSLTNVNPGNYYLDIWKDNDNSGAWSVGDFAGTLNSGALNAAGLIPFQIATGETKTFNINMVIL